MKTLLRAAAVLVLVGASTSSGLLSAEAASPVPAPTGGCWAYVPSAPDLDSAPLVDRSTALEAWTTVDDGGFDLTSGGATAVGGSRTVTASIASGPVISADADVSGTAYFLLSVDDKPLADPVETDFTATAGAPVADLLASTTLPVDQSGAHTVQLDAVYFDAPTAGLRVACNGQESGVPGASNPATQPLPTDLTTGFTAVAGASAAITAIADQAVLTSARTGDVVTLELAGLASSAPVTVALCDSAGTCAPVGDATTDADGAGTAEVVMPTDASAGADTLLVDDGTTQVSTPITGLGVQTVAAAEKLTAKTTVVTLTGTGWDPERPVTIRGYAGTDSSTEATSDDEVAADVDTTGAFTAKFVISDEATESVIVDQARTATNIGSVYLISGVIGGGGTGTGDGDADGDGDGDTGTDTGTDAGTDTGTDTGGGTVAPPVTVPGEPIPEPGDIPVDEVPGVDPGTETPGDATAPADLAVTEQHLNGHATLAELFGGAPKRDLVFLVENVGDTAVDNPIVRVSVGRSEDIEPEVVDVQVDSLDPGEQTVVTVPLELPMAAFGNYRVVGQVGDTPTGAFEVEWKTYPWGLIGLNVLALMLLAWGIRSRMAARRPAPFAPGVVSGDALIDLAAAEGWWTYRAGGPRPGSGVAPAAVRAPAEEQAGAAVVDLGAAEKWWARRGSDKPSQVS